LLKFDACGLLLQNLEKFLVILFVEYKINAVLSFWQQAFSL